MTRIKKPRVIGQQADVNSENATPPVKSLTAGEILRAAVRRATRRKELDAAEDRWDSEGGAVG